MAQASGSSVQVWDNHYAEASGFRYWPSEELVRSLAPYANLRHVLEVGCGNGANLWMLAEKATRITGLDFSGAAIFNASQYLTHRGYAPSHVDLQTHDLYHPMPFADGEFDYLVDCMTSQHFKLADHEALYREYARVLEPGGKFFLQHLDLGTRCTHKRLSTADGYEFYDFTDLGLFPKAGLTCLPPYQTLINVIQRAGFTVKGMRWTGREYVSGDCAHYVIIDSEKN